MKTQASRQAGKQGKWGDDKASPQSGARARHMGRKSQEKTNHKKKEDRYCKVVDIGDTVDIDW